MVREVADRLASLFCDDKIEVICVLGAPYVGKTWLLNHIMGIKRSKEVRVFDDVNTYERFSEIIERKISDSRKYIVAGRLAEKKCKEIIDNKMTVEYVRVYPMNFSEFKVAIPKTYDIDQMGMLKIYMLVGGLPEAVRIFMESGNIDITRQKQGQLYAEIVSILTTKARKVIEAVVMQEISDSTGFSLRKIDSNAREREYAKIIEELLDIGLIEKIDRFAPKEDKEVRKYRLKLYDIGLYTMVCNLSVKDLFNWNDKSMQNILYDFYYRELRNYINIEIETIKYWKKDRAKAKIPMLIEKRVEEEKVWIAVTLQDKEECLSRSVQSFIKEYPKTTVINVQIPTIDKVIDGQKLYYKISHNT